MSALPKPTPSSHPIAQPRAADFLFSGRGPLWHFRLEAVLQRRSLLVAPRPARPAA